MALRDDCTDSRVSCSRRSSAVAHPLLRFEQGLLQFRVRVGLLHGGHIRVLSLPLFGVGQQKFFFSSTSWGSCPMGSAGSICISRKYPSESLNLIIRTLFSSSVANSHACTFMGSLPLSDSFPSIICLWLSTIARWVSESSVVVPVA